MSYQSCAYSMNNLDNMGSLLHAGASNQSILF